jgi:predicted DNA-binding transcriptional regulator YafY
LNDLIEKVSDTLFELEGIGSGVSKRTIQADIQLMRSAKLGYNAPIVIKDRKYYSYADPKYSITNAPINLADVEKMKQVVSILKQFNGFNCFEEMSDIITRLESTVDKSMGKDYNCIQFEGNTLLRGLEHLNPLYQAIIHKRPILLEYKSFKAKKAQQQIYYPYLLKEYRNRWFLITKAKRGKILLTLALDRILEFQELPNEQFVAYDGVHFERYFNEIIGVTKSENDRPQKIILHINTLNAPYVLTKPLHSSQTVIKEDEQGIIIRLDLIPNFELEREILGFGEAIKVLSPRLLQSRIKRRLSSAIEMYATK